MLSLQHMINCIQQYYGIKRLFDNRFDVTGTYVRKGLFGDMHAGEHHERYMLVQITFCHELYEFPSINIGHLQVCDDQIGDIAIFQPGHSCETITR